MHCKISFLGAPRTSVVTMVLLILDPSVQVLVEKKPSHNARSKCHREVRIDAHVLQLHLPSRFFSTTAHRTGAKV